MTLYTRHVNLVTSRGLCGDWSLRVLVGLRTFRRDQHARRYAKGAGYIGGATFFLCWRCVDHVDMYRPRRRVQVGITRNANRVPWTRH